MSWGPYVDSLTEGGFFQACISGHTGQIWGCTPSFKALPVEVKALVRAFSGDAAAVDALRTRGFTVHGHPYALTRLDTSDDDLAFLVGRSKEHGAPARGVIVARTPQTVIVGVHDPVFAKGRSFGKAHVAIHQLADALSAMNF